MTPHQIEAATAIGWPEQFETSIAGWRVFAGLGPVGRVNSCWPLEFSGGDADQAIDDVERFYISKNLLPQFKLILDKDEPLGLHQRLLERGYRARNQTAVMTCDARPAAPMHEVTITPAVTQTFIDVVTQTSPTPLDGQERGEILARVPNPSAFGTIAIDGDLAAVGLAMFTGESAGIGAMRTKPSYCKRGYARSIVRAVSARAFEADAKTLWLQVETDNEPAMALYESEGFRTAYHYETLRLLPR